MSNVTQLPVKLGCARSPRRKIRNRPGKVVYLGESFAWTAAERMQAIDPRASIRLYEACLGSHGTRARIEMANSMYHAGLKQDARANYEKALRDDPDSTDAMYNLAIVYLDLDMHHEARALSFRVTSIEPRRADAWYNLALSHIELGSNWEAVRCFNRYLKLTTGQPDQDSYRWSARSAIARLI